MVMSALSAPLYAKALIDSVLRRKSKFVVTPKGDSASPDTWFGTFRYHWYFIAIFAGSIAAGFVFGHSHPAMVIWATFALLITAAPMFAWRHGMRQARKKPGAHAAGQHRADATPADGVRMPQQHAPHQPQPRPQWAGSPRRAGRNRGRRGPRRAWGGHPGDDQTMQIALGGLGGRKE